jgi:type VI secretion system secreted protein Hcp
MAFDAYMIFNSKSASGVEAPKGESLVQPGGITLGDSWSFSLENKLDISAVTTGAGAGKAEFQEFTIKKQVDTASEVLFLACGCGAIFNDVHLVLRKATGAQKAGDTQIFLDWTFNGLAIEKVEWAYGDPAPEETVTFKFGACTITYSKQDPKTGALTKQTPQSWSQVKANDTADVN